MWPWGVGQVGQGCPGWSTIVYMSSGMFRGKESSNRIELSWLVQELSNFGVFGFLRLLGVGGGWGVPPHMCTCMCMHTRTCMHGKHGNLMQMATPIGFGEILVIPYDVMCVCVCMWVGCTLSPPTTPTPTPRGETPGIIQNSIALELIEIFRFCLKIWNLWRLPHPWVGV